MRRIKGNKNNNNFLTFFMSVSFVVLTLIVLVGSFFIFSEGDKANADSSVRDEIIIDSTEWENNTVLMKQAADHLNIRYSDKTTVEDFEKILKNIKNKDVDDISDIVLVNQQLSSLPEALKHFRGLKRINLSGNQLITLPEYLINSNIEVIADNNILSDSYGINNQYKLYLLEIMEDDYKNIKIDGRYDESILIDIAKQSLWVTASLPKGGHSFAPLNGHIFNVNFFEDVDGLGGNIDNYIDVETKEVIRAGKIRGEFYIAGSTEDNDNARFPFEAQLSSEKILTIKDSILKENMEFTNLITKKLNLENSDEITENMLLGIKELEVTHNLKKTPEMFGMMANLEKLIFSNFEDTSISEELLKNSKIIELDFSNLKGIKILDTLEVPENIKKINLSGNNLKEIPETILSNKSLEKIDFSNNMLLSFNETREKYTLDLNILPEDFSNQRKIILDKEYKTNFSIRDRSLEEILDHLIGFASIPETNIEELDFTLLDAQGKEINKNSSDSLPVYFALKGADLKNANAIINLSENLADQSQVDSGKFETSIIDTKPIENEVVKSKEEIVENDETKLYIDYESLKNVLGEDTPSTIQVNTTDDSIVKKEVLEAIKENNKSLKINRSLDDENIIKYTFIITPENIIETNDLDLNLIFDDINVKFKEKNIVKGFRYSGSKLPENTAVDFEMKNVDGESQYYLYKFNEKQQLEYLSAVLLTDKTMTFSIMNPDLYFITNGLVDDGINNPGEKNGLLLTPLNILLTILGIIIFITFLIGGKKLFSKKEFATKMPIGKSYTDEYNNYVNVVREKDELIKYHTMEFDSITTEMLAENISKNKIGSTLDSLSLYEDFTEFNTSLEDIGVRYEGLEEHFGERSSFKRIDKKGIASYIDEGEFNQMQKKEGSTINENNFDEYRLNL